MEQRTKHSWQILTLLLGLALAGLEVPELFTLNDDVSNDTELVECLNREFVGTSYRHAGTQESLESKGGRFLSLGSSRSFSSTLAFLSPVKSGQDLLHFLSLQRK
jgi:hypothetical protein